MSGPSEKAFEAAWFASTLDESTTGEIRTVLEAAHDPVLGLDRSVCLRDIVKAFRAYGWGLNDPAAFIEREFGGGS